MKRSYILLALIALFLFAAVAAYFYPGRQLPPGMSELRFQGIDGEVTITAEVVDSLEEITTGLMFRDSLPEDRGMLFLFPDEGMRNFWMKNTLIPLDMIFIAENLTVATIHHAVPCKSDPCPIYSSEAPVRYVLEVNGNLTEKHGVKEGSSVELRIRR